MAWSHIQDAPGGGSAGSTGSGSSQSSGAFGSAVTLNNWVLVYAQVFNASSVSAGNVTCSDNAAVPNTYTQLAFVQNTISASDHQCLAVFLAKVASNPGSGNLNPVVSAPASSAINVEAAEFSGGSFSLDGSAVSATGNSTSAAPGNLTTANPDSLLVAVYGSDAINNPSGLSTPTNYTLVGKQTNGATFLVGGGFYRLPAAAGTFNPASTVDSAAWTALQLAILPGVAGAFGFVPFGGPPRLSSPWKLPLAQAPPQVFATAPVAYQIDAGGGGLGGSGAGAALAASWGASGGALGGPPGSGAVTSSSSGGGVGGGPGTAAWSAVASASGGGVSGPPGGRAWAAVTGASGGAAGGPPGSGAVAASGRGGGLGGSGAASVWAAAPAPSGGALGGGPGGEAWAAAGGSGGGAVAGPAAGRTSAYVVGASGGGVGGSQADTSGPSLVTLSGSGGAVGGSTSITQLYLLDLFTGADGTNLAAHAMDLGSGWSTLSGAAKILGNQANADALGGDSRVALVSFAGTADAAAEAQLTLAGASSEAGLVLRWAGPGNDNFYAASAFAGDGKTYFYKVAGSTTVLASFTSGWTNGVTDTMRVVTGGSAFTFWKGAALVGTLTDATFATATYFGLRSWQAAAAGSNLWDRFRVWQPGAVWTANPAGVGGTLGGGPGTSALALNPPSGGGVAGPPVTAALAAHPAPSGGAVAGPPAGTTSAYVTAASGGGVGGSIATRLIPYAGSGGGLAGGPAAATSAYAYPASGGAAADTGADFHFVILVGPAAYQPQLGATADTAPSLAATAAGPLLAALQDTSPQLEASRTMPGKYAPFTIARGEAAAPVWTLAPVPTGGIAGWTTVFSVKLKYTDSSTVISKAGSVTDATLGKIRVQLTASDTEIAAGKYVYDLWRTDAGSETRLAWGEFSVPDRVKP